MKNIIIEWVHPSIREQGGQLLPTDIQHAEIEMSADLGTSWSPVGAFPPSTLEVPVNDLPFSDQYIVRGRCVDTLGQAGLWVEEPFTLSDNSPPGVLTVSVNIQ